MKMPRARAASGRTRLRRHLRVPTPSRSTSHRPGSKATPLNTRSISSLTHRCNSRMAAARTCPGCRSCPTRHRAPSGDCRSRSIPRPPRSCRWRTATRSAWSLRTGRSKRLCMFIPGAVPGVVSMAIGDGHSHYSRYASGRGANPLSILAPVWDKSTGVLVPGATRVRLARAGGPRGWTQFSTEDRQETKARPQVRSKETYGTPLGNGDRSGPVHGLRSLRGGVPRREQPAGFDSRSGRQRPHRALDPDRPLLRRRVSGREGQIHAGAVPAVRRSALRTGLPHLRDLSQPGGAQRPGLQPLRRHLLLRQ